MFLQQIDREARKIVVENGGRHPCGSNALLYLPRSKGAEAYVQLRWNIKPRRSRVQLDSTVTAMKMVREFEERVEEMGRRSMVKEAFRFVEELDLELDLEHPRSVKTEVRKCQDEKVEEEVRNQQW